jgi:hypothetical protein
MAQIDTKDPKALGAALLLCAGLVGSGSMLGVTIEPEEVTELRIAHGKYQEKVGFLESELAQCNTRLEVKESKKGARQSQKGGK